MNYEQVAPVLGNLERSGTTIQGNFHVLNAWRY
jgi:hypothetical protein